MIVIKIAAAQGGLEGGQKTKKGREWVIYWVANDPPPVCRSPETPPKKSAIFRDGIQGFWKQYPEKRIKKCDQNPRRILNRWGTYSKVQNISRWITFNNFTQKTNTRPRRAPRESILPLFLREHNPRKSKIYRFPLPWFALSNQFPLFSYGDRTPIK